jgi:hypothetical protein
MSAAAGFRSFLATAASGEVAPVAAICEHRIEVAGSTEAV